MGQRRYKWIAALILNVGVRCGKAVGFTPRPPFPRGNNHMYPLKINLLKTKRNLLYTWGVHVLRYPNFFLGNGSR